jgi:hypothetical protein
MCGLFLSGCLDVENATISIEAPGDIITKLTSTPSGIELRMTEEQVAEILHNFGYLNDPKIMTVTNTEPTQSDCGVGNSILFKTYKRDGEYDNKKVEYVFTSVFSDIIQNGKCEYQLKAFDPVVVREPSHMEELK